MNERAAQHLIEALPEWASLQKLKFSCPSQAEQWAPLCAALPSSLTSIGVRQPILTQIPLPPLAAALRRLVSLRTLHLQLSLNRPMLQRKAEPDTASSTLVAFFELLQARPELTELNVDQCGNNSRDYATALLSAIVEHAKQLQKLGLSRWSLSRPANGTSPLSLLARCSDLQSLSLSQCGLEASDMHPLAFLIRSRPEPSRFTQLSLSGNPIGDTGLNALAQALAGSAIEQLYLDACDLSWTGFQRLLGVLSSMKQLRRLDLSRNEKLLALSASPPADGVHIDNAFSTLLARCPSLRELRLAGIGMKEANAVDLASGVKQHSTLTSLDLSDNKDIGEQEMAALLAAVGESRSLQQLDLGNCVPAALLPQLLAAVDRNSQLNRVDVKPFAKSNELNAILRKTQARRVERAQAIIQAKQQQMQQMKQQPQQANQLSQLQQQRKEAEQRATEAEQQAADFKQQLSDTRQTLEERDAALEKRNLELQQQHEQLTRSEQRAAAAEAESAKLRQQYGTAQQQIQQLEADRQTAVDEIDALRLDVRKLLTKSNESQPRRQVEVRRHSDEFDRVELAFHRSMAHMPKYAGQLSFRVIAIHRVANERLTMQFDDSIRFFSQRGFHAANRSWVLTAYHGTHHSNIDSIVENNLSMNIDPKDKTDKGYFSQHADYVMAYKATCDDFNDVRAGQSGKLLQFDILPGRMFRVSADENFLGKARQVGYDSHVSPSGFEYVMFDPRHVLPRYVISFKVDGAVGAEFNGSPEQVGPQ